MLFYNIILLFYIDIISPSGSPAFILNKISKILCVISSHLKFFPERPTLLEENGFCTVAGKSRGSRSRCRPALPPPAGPPSSGRPSLLRPAQRLRPPPCAPASYPPGSHARLPTRSCPALASPPYPAALFVRVSLALASELTGCSTRGSRRPWPQVCRRFHLYSST